MTYEQFKNKWLGKRIDADGVYQYQCVDLIRQYIHELYGKPTSGAWGNAIDYWTHTNANVLAHFDRVAGTDARQGDIVIFHGTSGNPYGHIGLVDGQNGDSILTLEQNGSTGNGSGVGGDAIRLRWISKTRVAGLLRPKGGNMPVKLNLGEARILAEGILGRNRDEAHAGVYDADLKQNHAGRDLTNEYIFGLWQSDEANKAAQRRGTHENFYKKYSGVIGELEARPTKAQLEEAQGKLTEQVRVTEIKDGEIKRLTDENAKLQAQVGDENLTIKQAIRVLYQTVLDAIKQK